MPQTSDPFVAWSCAQDYNAFSDAFRLSCEKHLRETQARLARVIGPPAVDGIILYDRLERGMAIAAILSREGRALPHSGEGGSCDRHFDLDQLYDETNRHAPGAAIHAESRAMLVRPHVAPHRRFILMDQRELARLHPMGWEKNPDLALASLGILAHEMAHARDYADGRLSQPSLEEIQARCAPEHAEALHGIADMATAEYVATRAECAAQVALYSGCSRNITARIGNLARQVMRPPALVAMAWHEEEALEQRQYDLSGAGYVLGTLAAYSDAQAPIMDAEGRPSRLTTADLVRDTIPNTSHLVGMLKSLAPALERAVASPDAGSRADLATSIETAFLSSRDFTRSRPQRGRSTAVDEAEL